MEYPLDSAATPRRGASRHPCQGPIAAPLDKQAMARELARELIALQQRGYTIEEVADSLRERGLEITTPTLKNYLERAKSAGAKVGKPRRPPGPSGGRAAGGVFPPPKPPPAGVQANSGPKTPVSTTKAESSTPPASESSVRSGKSPFHIKDQESDLV